MKKIIIFISGILFFAFAFLATSPPKKKPDPCLDAIYNFNMIDSANKPSGQYFLDYDTVRIIQNKSKPHLNYTSYAQELCQYLKKECIERKLVIEISVVDTSSPTHTKNILVKTCE